MKKQSERVSITNECMNNIKTIKLYSWEEIFEKLIVEKRNIELKKLINRTYCVMTNLGTLAFFPLAL
jgi:hypothetical protein